MLNTILKFWWSTWHKVLELVRYKQCNIHWILLVEGEGVEPSTVDNSVKTVLLVSQTLPVGIPQWGMPMCGVATRMTSYGPASWIAFVFSSRWSHSMCCWNSWFQTSDCYHYTCISKACNLTQWWCSISYYLRNGDQRMSMRLSLSMTFQT